MLERKVTVTNSRSQSRKTIITSATTLGELKEDFTRNGINYDGMGFYEGVSKTELKSDESVLPSNIPFKGQVTNDLVFLLSPTEKIKSGAERSIDIIREIFKENKDYADEVAERTGSNWTRCTKAYLNAYLDEKLMEEDEIIEDSITSNCTEDTNMELKEDIASMANILAGLLNDVSLEMYVNNFNENYDCLSHISNKYNDNQDIENSSLDSTFTEEEIDEMFKDLF